MQARPAHPAQSTSQAPERNSFLGKAGCKRDDSGQALAANPNARRARSHSHPAEMFPGAAPPAPAAGAREAAAGSCTSPTTPVSSDPRGVFTQPEASAGVVVAPRQRGMGRMQHCQLGVFPGTLQLLLLTPLLPCTPARGLLQGTGRQSVAVTPQRITERFGLEGTLKDHPV